MTSMSWHQCLNCGNGWQCSPIAKSNPDCPECGVDNHSWMMENILGYKEMMDDLDERFKEAWGNYPSVLKELRDA